jgi:hypothetical protein
MTSPFKPGEIAIGQNFADFPEHNGEDLLVIEAARFGPTIDKMDRVVRTGVTYKVESTNGEQFHCDPSHLRRRKPPAADSNERTFMQKWRDMADKAPQRIEVPA